MRELVPAFMSLHLNILLISLISLVIFPGIAVAAFCDAGDKGYESNHSINPLVVRAAVSLVPAGYRSDLHFERSYVDAVRVKNINDERSRERMVEGLALSAALLFRAGRKKDAIYTMRHLADLLLHYDRAHQEKNDIARDVTHDLLDASLLLAKYGDRSKAESIKNHIVNDWRRYERNIGTYSLSIAIARIDGALGDKEKAQKELKRLEDEILDAYWGSYKAAWALFGLVAVAIDQKPTGDENRILEITASQIEMISDAETRSSLMQTYRRFKETIKRRRSGETFEDIGRMMELSYKATISKRFETATLETSPHRRAQLLSELIDDLSFLRRGDDQRGENSAAWMERTINFALADNTLVKEPVATLLLLEALSRAGKFSIIWELMRRACDHLDGDEGRFRLPFWAISTFVVSRIAVPSWRDMPVMAVNLSYPILATGLDDSLGGRSRGGDPLPKIAPR